MKKSVVSALFLAIFPLSPIGTLGQSAVPYQSTCIAHTKPQSVGGANPRPTSVGGANPRPQASLPGWVVPILTLLHVL